PSRPSSPLFPYTALFRSFVGHHFEAGVDFVFASAIQAGQHHERVQSVTTDGSNRNLALVLWIGKVEPRGRRRPAVAGKNLLVIRSEEHTSELQSRENLVC